MSAFGYNIRQFAIFVCASITHAAPWCHHIALIVIFATDGMAVALIRTAGREITAGYRIA